MTGQTTTLEQGVSLERTLLAHQLPSVYEDFSDADFQLELDRMHDKISPEFAWLRKSGLKPYETDEEIIKNVHHKRLVRIGQGVGYVAIQRLADWTPERSSPKHEFYYSPPYLKPTAAQVLVNVANAWKQRQESSVPDILLPVTSLVRSREYQEGLASHKSGRKLAVDPNVDDMSGHQVAYDFDLDGCGLYVRNPEKGSIQAVHPRSPNYYNEMADVIASARSHLREVLAIYEEQQIINVVEELPGTKEHSFHVGVNPLKMWSDILPI